MNIEQKDLWMKLSGAAGLSVFILIHMKVFGSCTWAAAVTQLCVNAFVFTVGMKVFPSSTGRRRFLAFFWVFVPPIMAGITVYRVFL